MKEHSNQPVKNFLENVIIYSHEGGFYVTNSKPGSLLKCSLKQNIFCYSNAPKDAMLVTSVESRIVETSKITFLEMSVECILRD